MDKIRIEDESGTISNQGLWHSNNNRIALNTFFSDFFFFSNFFFEFFSEFFLKFFWKNYYTVLPTMSILTPNSLALIPIWYELVSWCFESYVLPNRELSKDGFVSVLKWNKIEIMASNKGNKQNKEETITN